VAFISIQNWKNREIALNLVLAITWSVLMWGSLHALRYLLNVGYSVITRKWYCIIVRK